MLCWPDPESEEQADGPAAVRWGPVLASVLGAGASEIGAMAWLACQGGKRQALEQPPGLLLSRGMTAYYLYGEERPMPRARRRIISKAFPMSAEERPGTRRWFMATG